MAISAEIIEFSSFFSLNTGSKFNNNYLKDNKMLQLKPKEIAIHTWNIQNQILVAIFQGGRGDRPNLDFRVNYLNSGS